MPNGQSGKTQFLHGPHRTIDRPVNRHPGPTNHLHERLKWEYPKAATIQEDDGAQGRNRTADTAIFSRMLYQLSYLGLGRFA
jgi:hypothetical protein